MADAPANHPTPMDRPAVAFLAGYLLLVTLLTGYVIYSLWSAKPRVPAGPVPTPDCAKAAGPVLTGLYPEWVDVGSTTADLLVLGCQFSSATLVKINGAQRPALLVDASHIRVVLTGADLVAPATLVVTLSTSGGSDFGSRVLKVVPPGVYWRVFGLGPWDISQEVQLLLLVLCTGAFGSCVYGLKSLADYRGDNKLHKPWFIYYLIQPFEGAGIAFLLYVVIRGGFLAGTGADVKAVNVFGICAIAGLAGAFSDTAFLKLREVFNALFQPRDDRGGKIGPLKITTTALPAGDVGARYSQTLQAAGGTAPLKWAVTPSLPAGLTLDADTGTLSGTPTAPSQKEYTFTVTDSAKPAASTSAKFTLEIKPAAAGLKITTTAVPDGAAGTPYPPTALRAAGGTPPLRWSVSPALPAGLNLDPNTGAISGTPAAASAKTKFTFTVTDSATPAASSTADLTLEIK